MNHSKSVVTYKIVFYNFVSLLQLFKETVFLIQMGFYSLNDITKKSIIFFLMMNIKNFWIILVLATLKTSFWLKWHRLVNIIKAKHDVYTTICIIYRLGEISVFF